MTGWDWALLLGGWVVCSALAAVLVGGFLNVAPRMGGVLLDLAGYLLPRFGRWLTGRRRWRWFLDEYGQELAELTALGTGAPGGRHHTDAGGPAW